VKAAMEQFAREVMPKLQAPDSTER
jgi:hypothetical protein